MTLLAQLEINQVLTFQPNGLEEIKVKIHNIGNKECSVYMNMKGHIIIKSNPRKLR